MVEIEYGLITIDARECTIAFLRGTEIEEVYHLESSVEGKTRKGGQSSARYQRIRENQLKEFFKECADVAQIKFLKYKLKGVIIGGPGPKKEDFIKALPTFIFDNIIAINDIGNTDMFGIRELVDSSEEILCETERFIQRTKIKRFLTMLAKGSDSIDYGEVNVISHINAFRAKTVFVTKGKDIPDCSCEIIEIENTFPEGIALEGLGGYGVILWY